MKLPNPLCQKSQHKISFFIILYFLFIVPKSTQAGTQVKIVTPQTLVSTLNEAKSGDEIVLTGGPYKGSIKSQLRGSKESPITIRGTAHTIWDGEMRPTGSSGFCLSLENSHWIRIESIIFKNCWATAISLKESQNIHIRNISGEGGRFLVKASGESTQYLTISNSHWNQDPSQKIWTQHPWEDLHHGPLNYFNGSILGATKIKGDIEIKENLIENAFNAIRMKGLENASGDEVKQWNANVNIHDNIFRRIRDNVLEPELSLFNWWFHHNTIDNSHAWISLTGTAGGEVYLFSNIGWNTERYGLPNDHDKGTIFKFEKTEPMPTMPIYIIHNSWIASHDYIRPDTPTRHLFHVNNIIHSKNPNMTTLTPENFDESYLFINDMVSQDPTQYAKDRWQALLIHDPIFTNISDKKLSLSSKSPARNMGQKFRIEIGNYVWENRVLDGAPDIGAYEAGELIQGPIYKRQ